ncbi:hypothetical protein [Isoptericola sp. G70]|uniref:hypothetical protein n=1 Tax=Isoptericola sp. G70 TaxID=3376633 RepID=UPI003A806E78
MAKASRVPRPTRKNEYDLYFASRDAERGWQDLRATVLNPLATAWDHLTRTPRDRSERCHEMKADLAYIHRDGKQHERWQYELPGGARIWYWVIAPADRRPGQVWLEQVHTRHPNQTK